MKNPKVLIFLIIVTVVIALGCFFLYKSQTKNNNTPTATQNQGIFTELKTWFPQANWTAPKSTTEQTTYGTLPGNESMGEVNSDKAMIGPFENVEALTKMGYKVDINLAAGGPGSSTWGYKKTTNGESQVITFSYSTVPTSTNPNEPLSFDCGQNMAKPCKVKVFAFESAPFKETK